MRILFVCTGNIFRSLTAEYCLKQLLEKNHVRNITVESAGLSAVPQPVQSVVAKTLHAYGIDFSRHVQRRLNESIINNADVIVAMAKNHQQFIKTHYHIDAPLFNELAYGVQASVRDVDEAIPNYLTNAKEANPFFMMTVKHIHDGIPQLLKKIQEENP